jgi:hypothetical protein
MVVRVARNGLGTVGADHDADDLQAAEWRRRSKREAPQVDGGMRPGRHDAGEPAAQTAQRATEPPLVRLAWALGTLAVMVVVATLLLILRARGAQLPSGFRTAGIVETLQFLAPAIVGAVLAARRPYNPIGWLLLGIGLCFALYPLVVMYVTTALFVAPGWLPGVRWVAWIGNWIWVPAHGCVALLFLLFPNGRLLSPRWRPVAWSALGATAALLIAAAGYPGPLEVGRLTPDTAVLPGFENPLGIAAFGPILTVMLVVVLAIEVLGIASLALRFRRSRGEERQQLKWVAYAGLFYGLQTVVLTVGHGSGLLPEEGTLWLEVLDSATALGLLIAIAVAVLKYRLYDIDRIINRTLVYGLLTAALGLCAMWPGRCCLCWWPAPVQTLRAGWSLPRPWPRQRCSGRPAAASRPPWTGALTGAATTRPGRSRCSALASATRSTWTRSRPSCWPWSTGPWNPPGRRCGCDHPSSAPGIPSVDAYEPEAAETVGFGQLASDPTRFPSCASAATSSRSLPMIPVPIRLRPAV